MRIQRGQIQNTLAASTLTGLVIMTSVCLPPASAASTAATSGTFGFSPGGTIGSANQADIDHEFDMLKQTGATWVRLDVSWASVEEDRGTYNWTAPDRTISRARAKGLNVLAILAYSPAWESVTGHDGGAPKDPADYAAFARAAAAHYAGMGVSAYELWNEPNQTRFWAPAVDPEAYARTAIAGARAVRSVQPDARIVSAGLAPAADRSPEELSPRTFLDRSLAAGLGQNVTAIGMHPYTYPATAEQDGTEEWNPFKQLPAMRTIMANHGVGDLPLWLTEYGAPTRGPNGVSEQRQWEILKSGLTANSQMPNMGPIFLYSGRDSSTEDATEESFGVLNHDFTPKTSYNELTR